MNQIADTDIPNTDTMNEAQDPQITARRRRRLLAAAVSVAVAGTVAVASAATLGGINTTSLGADQAMITSCESDGVRVESLTRFDPAAESGRGAYVVDRVKVSEIARACDGLELAVTLVGASGASLSEATTTLNASGNPGNPNNPPNQASINATLPVTPAPLATDVIRVAVVITG